MINTIAQAEQALQPYVLVAGEITGKDITTERTLDLSRVVGSPHERLKVIHVAGTSGKTSTCYFISRLLASAGASVGLTVSPHISSITERVQINTTPLDDDLFCEYLSDFLILVEESGLKPSYFELMMVFALWVFDKERLDYVVVETGLGGLHDSSNICRREDKVCVITDIGLDHTQILGETLTEIAAQKAGIIAINNQVYTHHQPDEVLSEISRNVELMDADLEVLPPVHDRTYQLHNSRLAYEAAKFVLGRDGLILNANALQKLDKRVIGRMQVMRRRNTTIILDGAHNEQKTAALVETLKYQYPDKKFAVVVAVKQTKDYQKVIEQLSEIASTAIATEFQVSQDAPIKSVDPNLLRIEFEKRGVSVSIEPSVIAAVQNYVSKNQPYVLVTGSLYALSEVLLDNLSSQG